MKVTELLQEFARDEGDNRKPPRIPPRRKGGDDDGDAKRISFKGETVFYRVSPVSLERPGYGLQLQLSLDPHAPNAASEFVKDEKVDAYKKDAESLDDAAIKLAFSWLNKHGVEGIAKRQAAWGKEEDKWNEREEAEKARARKKPSPKTLPKGYELFTHKNGLRFVKGADGLIPRQEQLPKDASDAAIIADFYKWYNRQ
jgi:hypothetical protein